MIGGPKKLPGLAAAMLVGLNGRPLVPPLPPGKPDPLAKKTIRPGWELNPLRNYPRKNPCFCGSALKMKSCCQYKISKAVPEGVAKQLRDNWERILAREFTIDLEEPTRDA